MNVRTGDTVLVISGRERGKTGQISRVLRKEERVVVGGLNLVKRHTKARPGVVQAGIIEKEAPIHVSNVMLICPACSRATRVGHRMYDDEGVQRKARVCKHCGEVIPATPVQG